MDIGGTLTKIVYFETNMSKSSSASVSSIDSISTNSQTSSPKDFQMFEAPIKKNQSFVNLEEAEHKAALKEIYDYMDKGDPNKTLAVRDDVLAFQTEILGIFLE